jgi:nucleoid DNA-binding protein
MAKKKKATKKKATKKKVAKKKTTKKVAAKKPAAGKYKSAVKPVTKSQLAGALAERHEVSKKTVVGILDCLFEEIVPAELKKHKKINLAGMVKFTEKKKPARKARKGINPFTGEEMMFKAKPASKTVKAVALKKLKDMV